jgi:polyhydroxybutyrate depolymerase
MAPMTLLATLLPMSSAPIASAPIASGTSVRELSVGGTTRTYRLYVPRSLGRRPAPLIVVLHGGFGTGATALRQGGWVAAARQHEFVAVAPDGLTRSWNAGGCCGPAMRNGVDDVGFVLAMLDEVARLVPIDRTRVFATGLSNGGMMAYRLGCEASDRFAAIAPVAATLITPGCAPTEPVSLLHIHGLVDGNVPFEGGLPTRSFQVNPPSYPPVREGIDRFVRADRCRTMPRTTEHGVVRTQRWRGGDRGADVELITIADGGHSWPGGMQMAAVLDPPSGAVDATEKIWRFFAAHPRR